MLSNLLRANKPALVRTIGTDVKLPFKKVMAANRGEIALRIMRASQELGIPTVAIYSKEDRFGLHRTKADQSFMLDSSKSPIAQYLDIKNIVRIAKENGVSAVHPGYGFLAENADFADAVEKAGMVFVGPTVESLRVFADKTTAREHAIKHHIPVVPGTPGPISTYEEAEKCCKEIGFPVIIKAAFGGGGKGMRVVPSPATAPPSPPSTAARPSTTETPVPSSSSSTSRAATTSWR